MNRLTISVISLLFLFIQTADAQKAAGKKLYSKEFMWSIIIPKNFEEISNEQYKQLHNKGADAIEETFDAKVEDQAVKIFAFRADQLHYFESNYQPYDTLTDGDYLKSCNEVNGMLFETFMNQMIGSKIDTASTVETIDGLEFQKFRMKIEYQNGLVLHILMFSRLFDTRAFTVNIMYVDEQKGKQMLDAFRNSTFKKS